jgi:CRP/FNR family transcriptional regulator
MKDFLQSSLPFWGELTEKEQLLLTETTQLHRYIKGTILYHGGSECTGMEIVKNGRARVYINSADGREITLYRILDRDVCMMSAACMIKNINFGISLETETDCEIAVIPREIYIKLSEGNVSVKNFTVELVASKFSDVMWLLEQLVFSNMGQRLAAVLLEQSNLNHSHVLEITHEKIAADLGTAREVVTRLLKQFQLDGYVLLFRGKIKILDEASLRKMNKK